MQAESTIFDPSPETAELVINRLASTDFSLRDIAAAFRTSVAALSVWVARPDIQERLSAIEGIAAQRARLTATASLHTAVAVIAGMLEAYTREERARRIQPALPAPAATVPAPASEHRERARANACRAANLLYRLARFTPIHSRAARPAPPPLSSAQSHLHSEISNPKSVPTEPRDNTPLDLEALASILSAIANDGTLACDEAPAPTARSPQPVYPAPSRDHAEISDPKPPAARPEGHPESPPTTRPSSVSSARSAQPARPTRPAHARFCDLNHHINDGATTPDTQLVSTADSS